MNRYYAEGYAAWKNRPGCSYFPGTKEWYQWYLDGRKPPYGIDTLERGLWIDGWCAAYHDNL